MSIFDRYAPFVQDYIYRNGWEDLRAIQVAAGHAIFNTDDHVLLTASTASGKTEAAFFPIITLFSENPPSSVGCIYIGPLKALINDQFARLNDLCEEADIPVWHWHGDVAQSHKSKLMKRPSGILQITPESLEAMLLHKHAAIPHLFGDLRFVVIDEVHSLLRGDRGGQTLCLIERLSRLAGVEPRRIGLSATIGDPERTGEFLSLGTGRGTIIPKIEAKGMKWRLSMEHFYVKDAQAAEDRTDIEALPVLDEKTDEAPLHADPGLGYIFEHTRGKKCLVFVNSREECETVTTTLRQYCELKREPDRFLIHHGNLSASYRETAEGVMKDDSQYMTTVTTATLELGIDIGRLERAFQIDAPWTVSSFLQRMGRTGRRELPPEMWFVMREDEPEARAMLPATIPWKLLQGIALVQLYLEERWVEPPRLDRLPFSLLYHQTMSTLASCGELSPRALADRVLRLRYFHRITQEDYKVLLRHLVEQDHIQRTEQGGLIVGLAGERVVNSYRFYGVFQENEEYTVRSEAQELGTVVLPPPVGEKLAIAGHVWVVLDVDRKRHLVYCEQVKGSIPAYFGLCPGDLHTKILQRMRQVLQEDRQYPYLMKNAAARLENARFTARHSDTGRKPLLNLGGNMWCLLPWVGTYTFLALERFLKIKCGERLGLRNLDSARPYYVQFNMKADEGTFYRVVAEEIGKPIDPLELVYPKELPLFDKYDEFLPEELVKKGFAYGVLDLDGLREMVRGWGRILQS
ncbi:MAG: DEAD/DEAH box helicase [Oscillospiraceae bacterium]|nr:DEAD/DEAH box helicase [Oscillospiraceae bacterium]